MIPRGWSLLLDAQTAAIAAKAVETDLDRHRDDIDERSARMAAIQLRKTARAALGAARQLDELAHLLDQKGKTP